MIVLFREHPNTHKEVYLTRSPSNAFVGVSRPVDSCLVFDTIREAYEFASHYQPLQWWRVGRR